MTFEEALKKTLDLEGGLVLHKNPTEKYQTYAGIYRKAHPEWEGWKYIDQKQEPPFELVRDFYYKNYWLPFKDIQNDEIKAILFDTAVNLGVKQTIKLMQRILKVVPDGILGEKTLQALNSEKPEIFILKFLLARVSFYLKLANKNPKKYSLYLRGWLNRVFDFVEV